MQRIRKTVRACIAPVLFVGIFVGWKSGTLCSVGYDAIAYVCPLGALESLFGGWAFLPRVLIALVVVAAVVLVFGRAFCSWVCPVPPLSALLAGKKGRLRARREGEQAAERALSRWHARSASAPDQSAPARKLDSRHVVLAGSVASAALCGFPVFCLVCPVGLTFASAIALYRLIGFNEPAVEVLLFPVLLVLELTVLRKWCHRFCPIGALLSLVARGNRVLQPRADESVCARLGGGACSTCASVCPEHIDPCANLGDRPRSECTRCGACVDACPTKALRFLVRKDQ